MLFLSIVLVRLAITEPASAAIHNLYDKSQVSPNSDWFEEMNDCQDGVVESHSDTLHLRTIILSPADSKGDSISADLFYLVRQKKHIIRYNNQYYPTASIQSASNFYDSTVVIGEVTYYFRIKLRPWER